MARGTNAESVAPYIRESFQPRGRLAVVRLNKRAGSVIQRLTASDKIAAPDFQSWLRHEDGRRRDCLILMSALREGVQGRTKADVAVIRHVYLDIVQNGTAAVEGLLQRDTPRNRITSSTASPDKKVGISGNHAVLITGRSSGASRALATFIRRSRPASGARL